MVVAVISPPTTKFPLTLKLDAYDDEAAYDADVVFSAYEALVAVAE